MSENFSSLDEKVFNLISKISIELEKSIPNETGRKIFHNEYSKLKKSRDAGTGRAGGKLQRDALCTRGRNNKSPISNRNLRWHPLVLADKKRLNLKPINRIEYNNNQFEFFYQDKEEEKKLNQNLIMNLPERFYCSHEHWRPHIDMFIDKKIDGEKVKGWSKDKWNDHRCAIPILEACDWHDATEVYSVLGISIATSLFGADFNVLYNKIVNILKSHNIDETKLPSKNFPKINDINSLYNCNLCKNKLSDQLESYRSEKRGSVYSPEWQTKKRKEGEDYAIQIMHLKPLKESEFRHNAKNVRYGHRKCNIMMSDHDVEDTIKLMKDIVENQRKKNW